MSSALLAAAAAAFVGQMGATDVKLVRQPSVAGNTVVFVYGGDIWKCGLDGGTAVRLTSLPGNEAYPKLSKDGSMIAFSGAYDGAPAVYVMPSSGGEPKRLTYGQSPATILGWTPDGQIAFSTASDSWRQANLYTVNPKGGLPKKTGLNECISGSFSPDGSKIAFNRNNSYMFNWRRYRGGTQGRVGIYDFATKSYSELPTGREQNYHPMWIGDSIYYLSDKNDGTLNIYSYNLKSKKSGQLTKFTDADLKFPSTDGKTIVFEHNGSLGSFDVSSGKVAEVNPIIVSDGVSTRPMLRKLGQSISAMALSPSGKRLVVEARGELFSVPARQGETRNMSETQGVRERFPSWSPDGQNIAYLSDATGEFEIYTMPQRGGKAEQITSGGQYKITDFRYSPDGKNISFSTLDLGLYSVDLATKKVVKVAQSGAEQIRRYDWSPDGNWIAYARLVDNLQSAIFIYDVKSGKTTQVTDGYYSDGDVSFDENGKYLYITSNRTFRPGGGNPFEFDFSLAPMTRVYALALTKDLPDPMAQEGDEEPIKEAKPAAAKGASTTMFEEEIQRRRRNPGEGAPGGAAAGADEGPAGPPPPAGESAKEVKIDFDGLSDRLITLPWGAGNVAGIVGLNNGVLAVVEGSLQRFDFGSRAPVMIAQGIEGLALNPKKTMMAITMGGQTMISPIAPVQPGGPGVNMNNVEAIIDPRAEWKQIFEEAWRYMRDRFYDPKFGGLDWNAKKAQYEAYLPYVTTRGDLNYVLGLMFAEVGTGHSYVQGGDMGAPSRPPVPVGMLGADLKDVNGVVQFEKIYRGEAGDPGPLNLQGMNLKDGDYLLAINGKPVGGEVSPYELLVNKVGRPVTLTVNSKPTKEGARTITVRPMGSEASLREDDWVESNRKKVAEMSNGRIGYMYVPNTSAEGMIGFIKGFYSQSDKDAILIDERFNGGGNIPVYFYEKMTRQVVSYFRQRNGVDIAFPTQTPAGPYAMLINEYAGSGGDHFPWLFRRLGVGPLIGMRTWGGLVGITGGADLVDGGSVTAPEFGLYDQRNGQWIAENMGIDPDIQVDTTPADQAAGRDPQLERGVQYLLKEVEKRGKPKVKRPDFKDLTKVKN